MLNFALSTDKLSLTTDTASGTIKVHVSYVNDLADAMTGGKQNTSISGAATTDIKDAPASGVDNVKFISIRNTHATISETVTVQFNANGTLYELFKCLLIASEELVMREGIWFHYDSNGGVYGQSLPVASDTVVGGIQIASQADLEAATDLLKAVTPGRMDGHPGVAKAVMFTTGTATPVASTPPTYNCTLTDTGVGQLTVNFTVAFSATTAYTVQVNIEVISTTLTAAANVMQGYMRFGGQAAAGSCQVNCCDRTATTNVIRDPISWHIAAYGDHA
jgi:hypothetical protein